MKAQVMRHYQVVISIVPYDLYISGSALREKKPTISISLVCFL